MSEVIYTKLELNLAKTFITGIWCDGVYFSAEPPLRATLENEQWVRTETAKLGEAHEDCILWRLERQVELKREAKYKKYRIDLENERRERQAHEILKRASRDEIRDEARHVNDAWAKAAQYKAAPSVRDFERDRKMLFEVSVKGRTHKDVAAEFGVSSSRVSQVIARQHRRDNLYWISRFKDHEAEGRVQDPEPEAADQGIGMDWTPETQHKEFELLRGIM